MESHREDRRKKDRRHKRVRQKVIGTPERPRLTVFRSLENIYCQLIDDMAGKTLASSSTMRKDIREKVRNGGNKAAAELVGKDIAEEAKKIGIQKVVFDRGGNKFHGRIKALAESARENKLVF